MAKTHVCELLTLLAALVAAIPGLIVLQALPRIAPLQTGAEVSLARPLMGALLPLGGALLGGLLLSPKVSPPVGRAGRRGDRALVERLGGYGLLLGLAAQGPALPGYVQVLSNTLALGYGVDAAVYSALYVSYLVLSGTLATLTLGYGRVTTSGRPLPPSAGSGRRLTPSPSTGLVVSHVEPEGWGKGGAEPSRRLRWWAQALGALLLLGFALATLGNPFAPLFYALFMGLAAAALSAQATLDCHGPRLRVAQALLVASAGVAALAAVLLAGSSVG